MGAYLVGRSLLQVAGQPLHHRRGFQQELPRVGRRDLRDIEPGVQRLADAIQHREGSNHKGEGGGEAERLVCSCHQDVLTCRPAKLEALKHNVDLADNKSIGSGQGFHQLAATEHK